jgi:tRNA (cmo5U34)-methyltransferase
MNRDTLFKNNKNPVDRFSFDDSVAKVFPDMIQRSVPGYGFIISQIGMLINHYARANSNYYDLGCSLGAATLSMCSALVKKGCRIIAVDNSTAMIKEFKNNIKEEKHNIPIDAICADIQDVNITNACVVVLNFTLQFINPENRSKLLLKIYEGLQPGGILILSEKIVFDKTVDQELQTELHLAFKKYNGYSDLEISQKRTALENVLIPDTVERHKERILYCGFSQCEVWFQCFNFVSLLAIK